METSRQDDETKRDELSRKRKSRFDIIPQSMTSDVPLITPQDDEEVPPIPPSSSFTMFISHDALPPPLPTRSTMMPDNSAFDNIALMTETNPVFAALAKKLNFKQAKTETGELISYVSVVEKSFEERLSKAMQKNFAFIDRKDEYAMLIIANGGDPFDQSLYPSMKKSEKFSMDMFAKKKASTATPKPGIGSNAQSSSSDSKTQSIKTNEVVSVYVSNLPTDITEDELEILFSPHGKIKKIKIYTDQSGKKKGDALITFANSDSVVIACGKLNRLDIGEGHVISVTKASFGNKTIDGSKDTNAEASSDAPMKSDAKVQFMKSSEQLHSVTVTNSDLDTTIMNIEKIKPHIPPESEMDRYPIVIIFNGYDIKQALSDDVYVNTIQMDLLLLCCEFGNVRIIQLFQIADDEAPSQPQKGMIAVTFETHDAAISCAKKFDKMKFNERIISTSLILPETTQKQSDIPVECNNEDVRYQEEAENVEDFLNSLL